VVMPKASEATRLIELVEHADHLDARATLTRAQAEFAKRKRRFLGVTSAGSFVGLASAREITELLSNQFGHALFGLAALGSHIFTATSPGPGLLACGIFDVIGHGVRPALITAILRALMEESVAEAADPGAI
jgi:serine phosphatase RsbU (regulator of sigma subunit)